MLLLDTIACQVLFASLYGWALRTRRSGSGWQRLIYEVCQKSGGEFAWEWGPGGHPPLQLLTGTCGTPGVGGVPTAGVPAGLDERGHAEGNAGQRAEQQAPTSEGCGFRTSDAIARPLRGASGMA